MLSTQDNATNTMTFNTLKDLFNDMSKYNQSFLKSENEANSNTKKSTIEGATIYRHIELTRNKLCFHGNEFGGNELIINGKLLAAKKIDKPDSCMSEYRLNINGRNEPLILLACKKR